MNRLIHKLFLFLVSREILIAFAVVIFAASIPMTLELWNYLMLPAPRDADLTEDIDRLVDGMAGLLVAVGVFFESRETIRALARHTKEEQSQMQVDLNEVAHHNGIGLLIAGLFMEILTMLVGLPQRVIATKPLEGSIFWACFVLTIVSFLILIDFVKDFVLSYFGRRPS